MRHVCSHEHVEHDDISHSKHCLDCGVVLEESDFVDNQRLSTLTDDSPFNQKYWQNHQLIRAICQKFSLGFANQASHRLNTFAEQDVGLVDRGRKGRLAAATCILLENRSLSNRAALSVADLSEAIQESPFALGKYTSMLKKRVPELVSELSLPDESEIFIERFFVEGFKPVLSNVVFDSRKIISLARDIYTIGSMAWLNVGRKPEPLYMACLLLAVENALILNAPKSKAGPLTKQMKRQVFDIFGLSAHTVASRYSEIVKLLVSEAKGTLPWDISIKNYLTYLADITKTILTIETFGDVNPPSFNSSLNCRTEMEDRVKQARQRLVERSGQPRDEIDLVVEKLLLKKCPVEQIVECSTSGQLDKLLDAYSTSIVKDNSCI